MLRFPLQRGHTIGEVVGGCLFSLGRDSFLSTPAMSVSRLFVLADYTWRGGCGRALALWVEAFERWGWVREVMV